MGGLARLNALPAQDAERELMSCCACPVWARAVAAGRPYPDERAALAAAAREVEALPWPDIRVALDAHPRIGARVGGGSREAAWSRREQAGARDADAGTAAALAEANRAYEERFGHVFLIRAAGRTPEEMLAELRRRLGNDPPAERAEVTEQLAQITALRVRRLVS